MIRLSASDFRRISGLPPGAGSKPPRASKPRAGKGKAAPPAHPAKGRLHGTPPGLAFEAWIPVRPRSKERARTFVDQKALEAAFRASGGSISDFARRVRAGLMKTLTPEATRAYEAEVARLARLEMSRQGLAPFAVPVEVRADFVLPGAEDGAWPTAGGDGDLDNMEKALLDALNGVAWTDDRLVVLKSSSKRTGSSPGIRVKVVAAPPQSEAGAANQK